MTAGDLPVQHAQTDRHIVSVVCNYRKVLKMAVCWGNPLASLQALSLGLLHVLKEAFNVTLGHNLKNTHCNKNFMW